MSEVGFGGAQHSILLEKIFLYHEVGKAMESNDVVFFCYVDDCGFIGPEIFGDVQQKLADLAKSMIDCVAHLTVVRSE